MAKNNTIKSYFSNVLKSLKKIFKIRLFYIFLFFVFLFYFLLKFKNPNIFNFFNFDKIKFFMFFGNENLPSQKIQDYDSYLLKPKLNIVTNGAPDIFFDKDLLFVKSGLMRSMSESAKENSDAVIHFYEVKKGDTLKSVSKLFNVSERAIMIANKLKNKNISDIDILTIFDVDGFEYTTPSNMSIKDIAKKYNIDADEIGQYNNLDINKKLKTGMKLFIPDAEGEIEKDFNKDLKKKMDKPKNQKNKITTYKNNLKIGYFMRPVNGCIKTQGPHGKFLSAIDFGCVIGTPVYAAADGQILIQKTSGYNGGYGNYIIIGHQNGSQTIYAHLFSVNVKDGDIVKKGQIIGSVGNSGRSTGYHLHFETRGIANPF